MRWEVNSSLACFSHLDGLGGHSSFVLALVGYMRNQGGFILKSFAAIM
jgi:hypothetical protein